MRILNSLGTAIPSLNIRSNGLNHTCCSDNVFNYAKDKAAFADVKVEDTATNPLALIRKCKWAAPKQCNPTLQPVSK